MCEKTNIKKQIYSLTTNECLLNGYDFNATEFGCEYAVSLHQNGVSFSSAIKAGVIVAGNHHNVSLNLSVKKPIKAYI